MKSRQLGPLIVSEIGYGTMSFANYYGAAPERSEAIRGAHERGVTHFDADELPRQQQGSSVDSPRASL